MDTVFSPSRVELARKRLGLTITALSRASGISPQSISNYVNGKTAPSDESVEKLAEALAVPTSFFYGDELEEIPVEAVSFRALSKMTARQRDAALGTAAQIVEFDRWLSEKFRFPDSDVPTLCGSEPALAAELVRARWGLGQNPVKHMVRLLEAHGVRMYSLRSSLEGIDAFSFQSGGSPFVLASTRKSAERCRFDAAHELGHLVMHSEHGRPGGPDSEVEANQFAAAFLMPKAAILAAGLRNATVPQILSAKTTWGVSAMALAHRLRELDLLTEWGYRDVCVQLSRDGYRSSEPGGMPHEISERLRQTFELLREDGISAQALAEQFSVSVDELLTWTNGINLQRAYSAAGDSPLLRVI